MKPIAAFQTFLMLCFLVAALNNLAFADETKWHLRLLILPSSNQKDDGYEKEAARLTVMLWKALETAEKENFDLCTIISKQEINAAATRLGLPIPDDKGNPVGWNEEAVCLPLLHARSDTLPLHSNPPDYPYRLV